MKDEEIAQQLIDLANEDDDTDPFVRDVLRNMAVLQIMPKEKRGGNL